MECNWLSGETMYVVGVRASEVGLPDTFGAQIIQSLSSDGGFVFVRFEI